MAGPGPCAFTYPQAIRVSIFKFISLRLLLSAASDALAIVQLELLMILGGPRPDSKSRPSRAGHCTQAGRPESRPIPGPVTVFIMPVMVSKIILKFQFQAQVTVTVIIMIHWQVAS